MTVSVSVSCQLPLDMVAALGPERAKIVMEGIGKIVAAQSQAERAEKKRARDRAYRARKKAAALTVEGLDG